MPKSALTFRSRRRAFTLLELLVVVAIIAALLGVLLVAYGGVRARAREAKTTQLVQSAKVAVLAYREQFGQLPPEVGPGGLWRSAEQYWDYDYEQSAPQAGDFVSPNLDPLFATPGSDFTIPAHLIGRNVGVNGAGTAEIDGVLGPGLRQPTVSGGYFWDGDPTFTPPASGRVYQPFVDSRVQYAFAQTAADYNNQRATLLVDPQGTAIRYYNFRDPKPVCPNASRHLSLMSQQDMESLAGNPPQSPTDLQNNPEYIPQEYRNIGFAIVAAGEDGIAGYWQQQIGGEVLDDPYEAALARNDNIVETGQ